jgi:hypothetical protein
MQPFRMYDAVAQHTSYSNTAKVIQQLCKGYTASLQKLYTTTAKAMQ